jgi:hypothetical protein
MPIKRNYIIIFFTVCFSVLSLIAFLILLQILLPNFVNSTVDYIQIHQKFILPDDFLPEPVETISYYLSVLLIPFLLLFFRWLFRKFNPSFDKTRKLFLICSAISAIVLIALTIVVYNVATPYVESTRVYIQGLYLFSHPLRSFLVYVIVCATVCIFLFKKEKILFFWKKFFPNCKIEYALKVLAAISVLMIITAVVAYYTNGFNNIRIYDYVDNDAVLYSISQVVGGKLPLVDFVNQYGLYSVFLLPIFKIVGLSVFTYTFVMACIMGLCYLCIYFLIKNLTDSKIIAFFGFITLFVLYTIMPKGFNYTGIPYIQYTPIRLLFPVLVMLLASIYFKKTKKFYYIITLIVASLGVFWNLDSGIIAMIGLTIVLCYREILYFKSSKNIKKNIREVARLCLKHILFVIISVVSVAAIYSLYAIVKRGQLPDWSGFLSYQSIYAGVGYYMLPMPSVHPWLLYGALSIIGLAIGVSALFTKKDKYKSTMILLVSIFSVGLFSYYQGRSHDYTFFNIFYLAVLLMIIFADKLLSELKYFIKKGELPVTRFILFFSIVFVFTIGTMGLFGDRAVYFANRIYVNVASFFKSEPSSYNSRVDFVVSNTNYGDEVPIFANGQSYFYTYSKTTNPIKVPGVIEFALQSDVVKIKNYLTITAKQGQKVFISNDYIKLYDLDYIIKEQYKLTSQSQDGEIKLYEKI